MIHSTYYDNYRGPTVVKVILGDDDITERLRVIYGELNNWQGSLWTYGEVFGEASYGKNFRVEFRDENGRDHWFHGFVDDTKQYFHPPLAKKDNQCDQLDAEYHQIEKCIDHLEELTLQYFEHEMIIRDLRLNTPEEDWYHRGCRRSLLEAIDRVANGFRDQIATEDSLRIR